MSVAAEKISPVLSTGDWRDDDVERWLTDNPLPADFVWNGERVYPRKTLREGYGQWLRTSGPYHPALRGLFRLCCDLLIGLPVGTPMPDRHELAALLQAEAKKQGVMEALTEPSGNPDETHGKPRDNPELSQP